MVFATYNALDCIARLRLSSLQQHAAVPRSGRVCLGAACARLVCVPLIYLSVRPRVLGGALGNAIILAVVAALALSNGFLATLSMMLLPRAPAELAEDAVLVTVACLYLGLATGATTSWAIGQGAMHLADLNCSTV